MVTSILLVMCQREEDTFTAVKSLDTLCFLFVSSSQIFYDLVRQINRKTPVEKKKAKKKSNCVLL